MVLAGPAADVETDRREAIGLQRRGDGAFAAEQLDKHKPLVQPTLANRLAEGGLHVGPHSPRGRNQRRRRPRARPADAARPGRAPTGRARAAGSWDRRGRGLPARAPSITSQKLAPTSLP